MRDRAYRAPFSKFLSLSVRTCAGQWIANTGGVQSRSARSYCSGTERSREPNEGIKRMAATAIDSRIFQDIFSTADMRRVFSDENRTRCYLDIEAALARVQARLGIIPVEAAHEIERQCRIENIDFARLKQQTERIGYPVLGV